MVSYTGIAVTIHLETKIKGSGFLFAMQQMIIYTFTSLGFPFIIFQGKKDVFPCLCHSQKNISHYYKNL
jgi:hypothetical protein